MKSLLREAVDIIRQLVRLDYGRHTLKNITAQILAYFL